MSCMRDMSVDETPDALPPALPGAYPRADVSWPALLVSRWGFSPSRATTPSIWLLARRVAAELPALTCLCLVFRVPLWFLDTTWYDSTCPRCDVLRLAIA